LKGGPRHKQKVSFQKKKTIFCLCRGPPFKKVFFCQPFFEKIQTFGFPNKNGIFEKIQGFPPENLPFHPFSQKRGREGMPG